MTASPSAAASPPRLSERAERFVRDVVETVPLARLVTLHLFSPLRQGTSETGVAVIAALPEGVAPAGEARQVVYTARYRAVLKGPDRGKWDVDVVAEADAPAITVEMVVRGVQQRAADADDPTRYEAAVLAAMVPGLVPDVAADAARRSEPASGD